MRHSIAIGLRGVVTGITEQLADLRKEITSAARLSGRDPEQIRILAVSKRQSLDRIQAARQAGLRDFGENYLQEALQKTDQVTGARWHFIGQLQSNKTRAVAENFDWVQSLASGRIAARLSAQRPPTLDDLQICIQLQPQGGERGGVPAAEVAALASHVASLPRLALRGLMVMPLPGKSAADLLAEFSAGRQLYERLRAEGHELDTLSMGMSGDIRPAVAAGSNMLRIGSRLFGARSDA